jgi:hypothetical protein
LHRDYRADDQRSATYLAQARDELASLVTETAQRTATGELSTENIAACPDVIFPYNSY